MKPLISHSSLISLPISMLVVMLFSCHSSKQTAVEQVKVTDTNAASLHHTSADTRQQWWRSLALELDSIELWLPDNSIAPGESIDSPVATPTASLSPQSASRGMLLKAKRATLTENTTATHSSVMSESRVDTLSHHTAQAEAATTATERVAVAKPPDIPWRAVAVIIALGVAVAIVLRWRKK